MSDSFTRATLGSTGIPVQRLGLSATNRPGKAAIHKALDAGVDYFFAYGFDRQMVRTLRELSASDRERYVLSTGASNLYFGHLNIRRTLEKRLRQFRTDYIDVFLFLGVTKPKHFPESLREEIHRLREEEKIRHMGLSCHNRRFVGQLAGEGAIDVAMLRYNAAHRGAEHEIFPFLERHNPGVVSYTATRWGYLLRRPRGWPKDGRIPTASLCYRFVLSNPHVHVCLTAPSNVSQLEENLKVLEQGPLSDEEMRFMREFGDVVHDARKWFM